MLNSFSCKFPQKKERFSLLLLGWLHRNQYINQAFFSSFYIFDVTIDSNVIFYIMTIKVGQKAQTSNCILLDQKISRRKKELAKSNNNKE